MSRAALIGILGALAGCAGDPGPQVHSCAELRALPPGPNDWSLQGIRCDGFERCTDGCPGPCPCPNCVCSGGRLSCYPGIDCPPYPDAAPTDDAATDANASD